MSPNAFVTPKALKRLRAASTAYIVWALISNGVAIALNRPAEFGGSSSGLPVVQDFLYGMGTALGPPLYWLAAMAFFLWLSTRAGRAGTIGVIALAIAGLLTLIGALGEPVTLELLNPATFDLMVAVAQVGMIILPFLMFVFGIVEIWRRLALKG